ncbi:MAG: hypothetical protein IKV03_05040 [Alphaproteobacteria bacterium]|nr:hypothetical protein [Alphaproteobacteria bacterium]
MDLGLSGSSDFFSLGTFSAKEIESLLNPNGVRTSYTPSAIQFLLNQGAEYLAQKKPFALETLAETYTTFLKTKSDKILSLTPTTTSTISLQNPLVCSFGIGTADCGFLALDWRLSYVLIDALLGGINGVSIEKKQDEPYSIIETNILSPIINQLLSILAEDRNISITSSELSTTLPILNNNRTRSIFLVKTSAVAGKLCLDLPSSLIPQEKEEYLFSNKHVLDLPIETNAVIGNLETTLSNVLQWQVGTQLTLGNIEELHTNLTVAHKKIATVTLKTETQDRQVSVEAI